jgi:hypothetical protein
MTRLMMLTFLGESRGGLFRRVFDAARASGAAGILAWIYLPPGIARRAHAIPWGGSDDGSAAGAMEVRQSIALAARRAWVGPDAPLRRGPLQFAPRFQLAATGSVALDALRARHDRRAVTVRLADRRVLEKLFRRDLETRLTTGSRWERQGYTASVSPAHAWGSDVGYFEYGFAVPRGIPRRVVVRATVSSERPGRAAPASATSPFTVSIEGTRIGESVAVRDDGIGVRVELASDDAALLSRLGGGVARVRFEVGEGPSSNGLCIYEPGVEIELRY